MFGGDCVSCCLRQLERACREACRTIAESACSCETALGMLLGVAKVEVTAPEMRSPL